MNVLHKGQTISVYDIGRCYYVWRDAGYNAIQVNLYDSAKTFNTFNDNSAIRFEVGSNNFISYTDDKWVTYNFKISLSQSKYSIYLIYWHNGRLHHKWMKPETKDCVYES